MSILYRILQDGEKITNYVNQPVSDRGEKFGDVGYGDEETLSVLEQISYAEDVRDNRRFTALTFCIVAEIFIVIALLAGMTQWMVNNLPASMSGILWIVFVVAYSAITYQCFKQSNMGFSEKDLMSGLSRNDYNENSTPTWERTDFGRSKVSRDHDDDDGYDVDNESSSASGARNNVGSNGVDKEVSPFEKDKGIVFHLWRMIITNKRMPRDDEDPETKK